MRARRGKAGVGRWLMMLAAGVLAVISPCARAWVERITQDSVEAQVADADLVIRGRLDRLGDSSFDHAWLKVQVLEVLKGDARVGATVRLDLETATLQAVATRSAPCEGLFAMRRSSLWREESPPVYQLFWHYTTALYLFEGPTLAVWDRMSLNGRPDGEARRMDGRKITTASELMAVARDAAAAEPARRRAGRQGQTVTLEGRDFPPESPIAQVRYGALNVPVDERLERMALGWLDRPEARYRARAAEVLRYFPSPDNRRRLRRLLRWDPGYELADAPRWEPARERRLIREYLVREAAMNSLHESAAPDGPPLRAPHPAYQTIGWAVLPPFLATILLPAPAGRRGGAVWRVILFGSLLVTLAVALGRARSFRTADSIGWSTGGASYEAVATDGRAWLLRVADGSTPAPPALRSEHVTGADGRPWFAPMLNPSDAVGALGARFERGAVSQPSYAYQMVSAPLWMVAAVPAMVPAWAAGAWGLRRARRRRRMRRGRCGACGYDLRASVGRRCPECGTAGRVRIAAALVGLMIAFGVAPSARAESHPEPSVEWLVERAPVIVRGEVVALGPADGTMRSWVATIRTAEAIKGEAPPRVVVDVPDWLAEDLLRRGAGSLPIEAVAFVGDPDRRVGAPGFPGEWALVEPPAAMFVPGLMSMPCMDGQVIRDMPGMLAMTREAVRFAKARGGTVPDVVLRPGPPGAGSAPPVVPSPPPPPPRVGGWLRLGSNLREIASARFWPNIYGLLVPQDARLEALSLDWMARPYANARIAGLQGIRSFRSPPNERRVRQLLADMDFDVEEPSFWTPELAYRGRRFYRVREAAAAVMNAWGIDAGNTVTQEPHPFYAPVGVSRVGWTVAVVLLGGTLIAACRRWSLGTWAAATCAAGALMAAGLTWRSYGVHESFSAARAGVDWEVTIGDGRLIVLRVEDGAPPHAWGVRRDAPDRLKLWPWYARFLKAGESGAGRLVTWERGVMHGPRPYPYRRWDVGGRAAVMLLAAWPGIWCALAAGCAVRRRRWRAAGRCGACGYDLRGSAASARCPECGGVTPSSRRPASFI